MQKILILITILVSSIFSVTLSPIYYTMSNPKDLQTTFIVKNPTSSPVAVTFNVLKLESIHKGKEKRVKSPEVSFYPSNFVLGAKSSRSIRVRYLGNRPPRVEKTFRIIATELDISIKDPEAKKTTKVEAGISMRYSYEGLMFIKENGSKMKLRVDSFKELRRDKKFPKQRVLEIEISNLGYASGILSVDSALEVTVRGKRYILNPKDMEGIGRNLARRKTTFLCKKIKSLPQRGKIEKISIVAKPKIKKLKK